MYAGAAGVAGRDHPAEGGGGGDEGAVAEEAVGAPAVTHHSHALWLAEGVWAEGEIIPDGVKGVFHVSGSSVVRRAALECFDIEAVVDHVEGLQYVPCACC